MGLLDTVLARRRRVLVETIGGDLPAEFETAVREVAARLDRWA